MIETRQSPPRGVSNLSRETATSVDIIKLLDKLEELVEESVQIFGRAVWVNADEFFVHTNKIRAFLPEEMKNASKHSKETEKLMEETQLEVQQTLEAARREGQRYIEEARAKAMQLIGSHEIKKLADEEAAKIIEEAKAKAQKITSGADDYAREVLASLDAYLGKIRGTIQRGRSKLESREGISTK